MRCFGLFLIGFAIGMGVGNLPAPAANPYDGVWTVSLVTAKGDCPATEMLLVAVRNGAVEDLGVIQTTGLISDHGAMNIRLKNGTNLLMRAQGFIKGSSGAGTWEAPPQRCFGRWTASRN
jgi:hypothetical protein